MNSCIQKIALVAILLTMATIRGSAQSSAPTGANGSMNDNSVRLGEHSKLIAQPGDRDRIRSFYQGVLGCKLKAVSERLDSFELGSNFYIGVIYDATAPATDVVAKGIWLELQADDPEDLKARILRFGIQGIDYFDKKHFYFQAPGGQVFRIVQTGEVL
jgi:hypothetical protein